VNRNSYFLFRVLQGIGHAAVPQRQHAPAPRQSRPRRLFDVAPLSFFGMLNTSPSGKIVTLSYMSSQQITAAAAAAESGNGMGEEESRPKRRKRHNNVHAP
jgi:hypothetical protein